MMEKLLIIHKVILTFCIILSFFMVSSASFAQDSAAPTTPPTTSTSAASAEKASPNQPGQPAASTPSAPQMKAPQQPIVGQIVWVVGTVKAVSASKDIPERFLDRRSPVYLHDTILSDQKSTCQIVFSDNSTISMRSDTVFRVDEYAFGKDVPPGKAKFVANVVKGGFRTITGLIPKENPGNYQVKTPVATIAVQGTDYEVFHTPASAVATHPAFENASASTASSATSQNVSSTSATSASPAASQTATSQVERKNEALTNASAAATAGHTVVARISGTPVVTTGGKTIILNDTNKYISVPDIGKLVSLPHPPIEFTHPVKMESAIFSPQEMNMTVHPVPTSTKTTTGPGTGGGGNTPGPGGTTGTGGGTSGTSGTGTTGGGTSSGGTTSTTGTSGTSSGTSTDTGTSAPSSAAPSSPTSTGNFCVM